MTTVFPAGAPGPRSILVILPTWVGDFVMATPSLRAVRQRFPSARITFLLEPNLWELARGGDWMDEWISWPQRGRRWPLAREFRDLVRDLRSRRFDCAVLLSNSFRAALCARLAGAVRRVGYDRDGRGWLLTHPIPVPNRRRAGQMDGRVLRREFPSLETTPPVTTGPHLPKRLGALVPMPLVEYYGDLVEAMGCARAGDRLELFTTNHDDDAIAQRLKTLQVERKGPWVVISPGAKFGASKCWMPERFAETADRLVEQCGATVFITCGPGEEFIAAAIQKGMNKQAVSLTNPLLTLGQLKSLIRQSDLLLANDAGPRHIAKAFGVAVVTLFGPTHPDWTATHYALERIVRVNVDCGPCQQRVCPLRHHQCMKGVSVDAVVAAAQELLSSSRRP